MLPLCTRFARQASCGTHPTLPLSRLQGRLYSNHTTGNQFPKATHVFFEKKPQESVTLQELPKERIYVDQEIEELRSVFEDKIDEREFSSGELMDPEKKEKLWEEILLSIHHYRRNLLSLKRLANSKKGRELKEVFLMQVASTEAWKMAQDMSWDLLSSEDFSSLPNQKYEPIKTAGRRRALAKACCSVDRLIEASEEALRAVFSTLLNELERMTQGECSHERSQELWKIVSERRLGVLEKRIASRMQKIWFFDDGSLRECIFSECRNRQRLILRQRNTLKDSIDSRIWG